MSRAESDKGGFNFAAWAVVMLIILAVGMVRARLLNVPLERDEGEYAYTGQLLLQGVPPFKLAYTMKLPGTTVAYALFMALFGQSPMGIRLGFLFVNAITIVLVFLLGKKLLGSHGGVIACATYAIMSLSYSVLGLAAHATHFVVLFALAGILVFLRAMESGNRPVFFAGGLMFGVSFLMKQPGMFFVLLPAFLIVWFEIKSLRALLASRALGFKRPRFNWPRCLERLGMLFAGFMVPFVLTCLLLWWAGVFRQFWFWTFSYVSSYGSRVSGHQGFGVLLAYFQDEVGADIILWLVAGLGLLLMLFDKKSGDRKVILLALLVVSLVAVCPGLYFRSHYFVLALPAVALLAGYAATFLLKLIERAAFPPASRAIPSLVFSGICLLILLEPRQRQVLFKETPGAVSRDLYANKNPFVESLEIARYIREHTAKNDRIAVLGSEPQICFEAGRRSATSYIYTYSLMEPNVPAQRMQEEMIRQIETGKPEILVVVELPLSWLATKDSEQTILNWLGTYPDKYYDVVGELDFLPSGETVSHWGAEAGKYEFGRDDCIFVLKRKPSA